LSEKVLSEKTKILLITPGEDRNNRAIDHLKRSHEVTEVSDFSEAYRLLHSESFSGIFVGSADPPQRTTVRRMIRNEQILEGMSLGVALLDEKYRIVWCNARMRQWSRGDDISGVNFYEALGGPEIVGPDFCPFHTALATGRGTATTLRDDSGRYFQIHAEPLNDHPATIESRTVPYEAEDLGEAIAGENFETAPPIDIPADVPSNHQLIVTVRDTTHEIQQQQKIDALHRAGMELADLLPEELAEMSVEDRTELLKSNILHYTKDLLNFDVVEVRLLNRDSSELEPLLEVGMDESASGRRLYARTEGNGVTGFVAATGKSYLCEDTTEDPLYMIGASDAKSSLTVPLILHDEVIGTFNVESPRPGAFSENDLQFLEIFGRNVAAALNQLHLQVAEQASATAQSCEAIHSAVALPIDDILSDAVNIMERYIGHEPEVTERLRTILQNARDIKTVIQKIGRQMAPTKAYPAGGGEERPLLAGRRILVVDIDAAVRSTAHQMLERYGCEVETAQNAADAIGLIRAVNPYDVIIADIRLPDMDGYQLLLELKKILANVPLVLMTGFGYDPGHAIVKARREMGELHVLYKPFRLEQLLGTIEKVVAPDEVQPNGGETPPSDNRSSGLGWSLTE